MIATHKSLTRQENQTQTVQNKRSRCTHLLSETCTSSFTIDLEITHNESKRGTFKSNS